MTLTRDQARHLIQSVLDDVEIITHHGDTYPNISLEDWNNLVQHFDFVIRTNPEICPECLRIITDEEFKGHNENRDEFGGKEFISTGFVCKACGHEEVY